MGERRGLAGGGGVQRERKEKDRKIPSARDTAEW